MFSSGSSPYSPFFTSGLLSCTEDIPAGPRRGSLPTDSLHQRSPTSAVFYANMQPKRDHNQYRSFLSLDLAESMRSASLKRPVPTQPGPSRLRESLRSMPSPKPAPSIDLPDLPTTSAASTSSAPPRLPSIPKLPSLDLPVRRSFLSSLRFSRTPKRTASTRTSSSISTRVKKTNRNDALARLEGRSKPHPSFNAQNNFISLSDDEDDDTDESVASRKDSLEDDLFYAFFEPEDLVLPPPSPVRQRKSYSFKRSPTKRTTADWFPLKSFIDLKNDDESSTWSWRSFIDVASIS